MWIVEFTNYKDFLKESFKKNPEGARGQAARLARHLKTGSIVVSQILRGDRHLTPDQAFETSAFLGLDDRASEYFMCMVCFARAEKKGLKEHYERKMDSIREEARKIQSSVAGKEFLSEWEKGIFYSNWYYAAISCLVSIKGYQTIDAISEYFDDLPKSRIAEFVSFLVASGICKMDGGLVVSGKTSSFITEPSPFLNNHRRNWRLKAIGAFSKHNPESIHYSNPVSLSKQDAEQFRKELKAFIEAFPKRVRVSVPEEKLMCLNIDWFEY